MSLFVHGEWISGYGKALASVDPATGEIVWSGTSASQSDVVRAIKAAKQMAPHWAATPLEKRIEILRSYEANIKDNSAAFAESICKETGKTRSDANSEVKALIAKVSISIDNYNERCPSKEMDGMSLRHRPHGVVGVLGPFNFPAHLPNGHIIPALLAGNTVVFKPSDFTPMVGELLVKSFISAGLPKGVLNLVQGGADVGKVLSLHKEIDALFFTGSASTGLALSKHYGAYPEKMLALEMGGNNALVVGSKYDLNNAIDIIIQSAYLSTGQRCTCARRLIIMDDALLKPLSEKIATLTIGHYTDDPFMGPLINDQAVVRLLSAQASLKMQGANIICPLEQVKGNLVTPALIDVTGIEVPDEENFGPFLQVIRVSNFHKAIETANNTRFGLSAALISNVESEWKLFYDHIKAGIINWNRPTNGASSSLPFGGIGHSGNHRPSAAYAADYCAYPVSTMAYNGS